MVKVDVTITDEVIQQVKEKLVASTKSGNRSVSDIVRQMKNEIRIARKAGKTWKEIETILSDAGINASRPLIAAQCPSKKKEKVTVRRKKESVTPAAIIVPPVVENGNSALFQIKPDRTDL